MRKTEIASGNGKTHGESFRSEKTGSEPGKMGVNERGLRERH